MPVEEENRAITGVEGLLKCGALERDEAAAVGLKWPVRRTPLAWTDESWCQRGARQSSAE
jgi:hypothetical protein